MRRRGKRKQWHWGEVALEGGGGGGWGGEVGYQEEMGDLFISVSRERTNQPALQS